MSEPLQASSPPAATSEPSSESNTGDMADILRKAMISPPSSPFGGNNFDLPSAGDDDEDPPAPPGNQLRNTSNSGSHGVGPIRTQEFLYANRLAAKLRLHPYQHEILRDFARAGQRDREMMLVVYCCSLEKKLEQITVALPKFSISDPLQQNINKYAFAVLLSTKLLAYKGNVPRDCVTNIILRNKLHVPDNIDKDHHARNLLGNAVQDSLTQRRSEIKKAIKASKNKTPGPAQTIHDLAVDIVSDSGIAVTVELCARLALLRHVHTEDDGSKYWDKVDDHLKSIRKMANGDSRRVTRAFGILLERDRDTYGMNGHSQDNDRQPIVEEWQMNVDDEVGRTPDAPGDTL